jgi:hypothetical protein
MKSFAGGAHAWRMSAWRQIPDYPSWFIFHGEEDFAAYEMFKKRLEIHYLPSVLVHHRVDLKARKKTGTIPSGLGVPLERVGICIFVLSVG